MAHAGTRVMQQRRLRAELRRLREDASLTQKSAAESTGWSTSKIIRMETGGVHISPSDVMALVHVYKSTDQELNDELLAITRAKDTMWWDAYRDSYPRQFLDFLDFENSAVRIRQYMGFVIPGLLQTEEYARALIRGYANGAEVVERGVAVRMRRQQRLTAEDGPQSWFVIDEAALHRWIGGADVMRHQLTRLKEVAREPKISIRVVPFAAGMHPGMRGSFTIFEYPLEDFVVNVEDPHSDALIRDDPESASRYVETFYELEEFAIGDDELDKVIDPVVDTMRTST